jgi:hypothetical protein
MSFLTIDQESIFNNIADQILMREIEIFSYDMNITNYEIMLAAMPQEDWPENIVQYKNATLDLVPDDLDQIVSEYQYRDRIRYLIKTERAERAKSFAVYNAMITRLPQDRVADLIAQAQVRAATAQAASQAQSQ